MKLFRQAYEQENGLPIGYTEVEYLESTGTQYIDTGVGVKSNTVVKAVFSITSEIQGKSYFGARNSTNERFQIVNSFGVGAGYFYNTNVYPIVNKQFEIEMHASGEVYLDGIKRDATNGTFSSVAFDRTLYIFHTNYYDGSGTSTSSKFWKVQISEGDRLVRDYIPALDPSGRPCMYDKVEGKPYYNLGTGEFSYGKKIYGVEYLGFTGAEYIQTDFDTTNATSFKYKVKFAIDETVTKTESRIISNEGAGSGIYFDIYYALSADKLICRPPAAATANTITHNKAIIFEYDNTIGKIQGYYEDDPSTLIYNQSATFTAPTVNVNYRIGCRGNNTGSNYLLQGKIYSVYFERENKVRDFIPVKDENNTPFMFDKVTHTAYLNAGTGNFTYGEDATKHKTRLCFVRPTGGSSHMLPKGFTEVEYLESSGIQYIDTGVYPTQLTEAEYRCAVTGSVANVDSHLFGSRLSASSEAFDLAYMNTSLNGIEKFRFIHGTATAQETTTSVTASQLKNPHTYYMSGTSFKIDDSEKMSFTTESFTGSYSLWLFGLNMAGSLHNQVRAQRVYKCKIWNNNVLVRDYIPCLDASNTPCMYDRVEGKAYYNQGTGSFTVGKKIIPVEYLESTGAQYINTGIASNLNTAVEMNLKVVSYSANNTATFFGGLSSNVGISTNISKTNTDRYSRFGTKYTIIKNLDIEGIKSTVKINKDAFVVNGQSYDIGETDSFNGPNMYLFKADGITSEYNTTTDVYGCKIWDTDTLVRNFIPVIDEDNTAYMFDRVTHTLFANAGTGEFLYGDKKQNYYLAVPKAGELLPAAYRRLEYIEGTGTQYINTDTKVDVNTKFILDYQMTDITTTTNGIFGASGGQTLQFLTQTGQGKYVFQWTPNSTLGVGTKDTDKHRVIFDIPNTNISVDDDTVSMASWTFDYPTGNIMLFANGHLSVHGRMKAYGSKIYNGNTLVRHFIPALRKSDNKPGMYDAINNVFYTNAATGADFSYA